MAGATDAAAPTPAPTEVLHPGRLLLVVCISFLAMGMAAAGIGPALPDLSRQTHSTTVAAGGALAALFAGAVVAQTASGLLLQRLGRRRIMVVGMSAFVLGDLGGVPRARRSSCSTRPPSAWAWATGPWSSRATSSQPRQSRGAGPLNLVNAMFGVGSILSPALIGLAMTAIGTGMPVLWTAPCAMLVAAGLLVLWAPRPAEPHLTAGRKAPAEHRRWRSVLGSPLMWTICGFLFAYQSVEVVVTGWLPTILQRSAALPLAMGALAASWFWLLITAVRFGAASASRLIQPRAMLRVCVGLCVVGGALLVCLCSARGARPSGSPRPTALGPGGGAGVPHRAGGGAIFIPARPGGRHGPRDGGRQHRGCGHALGAGGPLRQHRAPRRSRCLPGPAAGDGASARDHRPPCPEGAVVYATVEGGNPPGRDAAR